MKQSYLMKDAEIASQAKFVMPLPPCYCCYGSLQPVKPASAKTTPEP